MFLEEVIFKLSFFFIIGFVFGLSQFFFLSYTENTSQRKGVYSIASYFPLSYGVLLPIIGIFLGGSYYPIGMVRYPYSKSQFDVDHSSSRIFAYCILLLIFILLVGALNYLLFQHNFQLHTMTIWHWFLQVLTAFLIFNLLPFFPSVLGGIILKELKYAMIKYKKIEYLQLFHYFTKMMVILFFLTILSLNYFILDRKILSLIEVSLEYFAIPQTLILCSIFILLILIYLVYRKKKEYKEYIDYIRQALADSFLNEQKIKKQDKFQK